VEAGVWRGLIYGEIELCALCRTWWHRCAQCDPCPVGYRSAVHIFSFCLPPMLLAGLAWCSALLCPAGSPTLGRSPSLRARVVASVAEISAGSGVEAPITPAAPRPLHPPEWLAGVVLPLEVDAPPAVLDFASSPPTSILTLGAAEGCLVGGAATGVEGGGEGTETTGRAHVRRGWLRGRVRACCHGSSGSMASCGFDSSC
jgi:hypothetical protein